MKKTIVHVIDSLGRGGTETKLVALLPELNKVYQVVLVTLNNADDFDNQIQVYKRYCLNCNTKLDVVAAVFQLKKIIKTYKPALVRTQLFWSTFIGRLATPASTPFIFSVHSTLSLDAFKANPFSYWLEKWTYRKRQALIAVSHAVLKDYDEKIGIKGKAFVLNNFVQPAFFQQQYSFQFQQTEPIRIVAVGNLKEAKNYQFLLNVLAKMNNVVNITVDIIGEGHLREPLQHMINHHNLPVSLAGKKKNVDELLPQYDIFIMCSLHEGFPNAPIEAMAIGLPLILNDSDTMKEMSKGNALFYKSDNENSLIDLLTNLKSYNRELSELSEKGKEIASKYYNKENYFLQLQEIYEQQI